MAGTHTELHVIAHVHENYHLISGMPAYRDNFNGEEFETVMEARGRSFCFPNR